MHGARRTDTKINTAAILELNNVLNGQEIVFFSKRFKCKDKRFTLCSKIN